MRIRPLRPSIAFRAVRIAALLGLAGLPLRAGVDAYTWTGGGSDGNWSTAASWQTGVPASSTNTALFFGGTSQLPSIENVGSSFFLTASPSRAARARLS